MLQTPWAILLCKFSDNDSEPFQRQYYEDLFTSSGRGSNNMVDFFDDVSHGNVDLSGSRVFGWYKLDQKFADYKGSGPNPDGRQDLINWAQAKATADGFVRTKFFNVVVCMNVNTDLFGSGAGVVCHKDSMQPSLLGQEMGHGYGLDHSRRDGSTADYKDNWDVMSTAGPYEAPDPKYQFIGPGLNAANMDSRSWLDGSRIWSAAGTSNAVQTVQLRPLHRRDLPGFLAARVWDCVVEFRVLEKWDANIRRPAILVHRFEDNHSYIMPGTKGQLDLVKGDKFQVGDPANVQEDSLVLEVLDIDACGHTATLGINTHIYVRPRMPVEGPAVIFGGVRVDGGGGVFIDGHIIRVPPRSELEGFLREIAAIQVAEALSPGPVRNEVRAAGYRSIIERGNTRLGILTGFRVPAPRNHKG